MQYGTYGIGTSVLHGLIGFRATARWQVYGQVSTRKMYRTGRYEYCVQNKEYSTVSVILRNLLQWYKFSLGIRYVFFLGQKYI
jgi:hypothetical protein